MLVKIQDECSTMTCKPQTLIAESLIPLDLEGKDQKLLILQTNRIKEKSLHKGSQIEREAHLDKIYWKRQKTNKTVCRHDKHG